jgi:hypothetical protein
MYISVPVPTEFSMAYAWEKKSRGNSIYLGTQFSVKLKTDRYDHVRASEAQTPWCYFWTGMKFMVLLSNFPQQINMHNHTRNYNLTAKISWKGIWNEELSHTKFVSIITKPRVQWSRNSWCILHWINFLSCQSLDSGQPRSTFHAPAAALCFASL